MSDELLAPSASTPTPADPRAATAPSGAALPVDRSPLTVDAVDLHSPALFINRELSWLEFNRRVLHEARDPRTPLLERVKFLSIFGSNLDEFFQVRGAGLRQQGAARLSELTSDGMSPEDQLRAIAPLVRELQGPPPAGTRGRRAGASSPPTACPRRTSSGRARRWCGRPRGSPAPASPET